MERSFNDLVLVTAYHIIFFDMAIGAQSQFRRFVRKDKLSFRLNNSIVL